MDLTDPNNIDRIVLLASLAFTALVIAIARWGLHHPRPAHAAH
jgi:hypothetical protein